LFVEALNPKVAAIAKSSSSRAALLTLFVHKQFVTPWEFEEASRHKQFVTPWEFEVGCVPSLGFPAWAPTWPHLPLRSLPQTLVLSSWAATVAPDLAVTGAKVGVAALVLFRLRAKNLSSSSIKTQLLHESIAPFLQNFLMTVVRLRRTAYMNSKTNDMIILVDRVAAYCKERTSAIDPRADAFVIHNCFELCLLHAFDYPWIMVSERAG
jgi:hypothetical protein